DQAALDLLDGRVGDARKGWQEALTLDGDCEAAKHNLAILDQDYPEVPPVAEEIVNAPGPDKASGPPPIKVAVVRFLFNWPSTGGGIVHTVELCQFLARAGFEVRHFYVRYQEWGIGNVQDSPIASVPLDCSASDWTVAAIKDKLRQAVDAFAPDQVII